MHERVLRHIAHIHTDFPTKFGVPRQSGLVDSLKAVVQFLPEFRSADAVRGLEEFSHIWLIWEFSQAVREKWSPTVRPPRLGGNARVGVFASRSPFRPNPIGLSSVRLEGVELHPSLGPLLHIAGADLMDGTPIYDIKPSLPYGDCHPDAAGGFTDVHRRRVLDVDFPPDLLGRIPPDLRAGLLGVLGQDPRPAYHHDPARQYVLPFARWEVRFTVAGDRLTVRDVRAVPSAGGNP